MIGSQQKSADPEREGSQQQVPAVLPPAEVTTGVKLGSVAVAQADADMILGDAASKPGFDKEDVAIPFLRVVQSGSPQRKKDKAEYIDGAEEGDIFNSVNGRLWKGKEGVVLIPCWYNRDLTIWKPRGKAGGGGGLVQHYGADLSFLKNCTQDAKGKWHTPDGNDAVLAGTHWVLVVDPESGAFTSAVLSLSGTQGKKSRRWNTLQSELQIAHPDPNLGSFNPASFYMSYRMTTVPESNDQGDWFGVTFSSNRSVLELPKGRAIYFAARAFAKMVEVGEVKAAPPPESDNRDDKDIPF